MAKASLAWLAWREGRPAEVRERADAALALWSGSALDWPFQWVCLWPLIAVGLAAGEISEAVATSRKLLTPSQQRFPDELEAAVQAAIDAFDKGEAELAGTLLGEALELAQRLRYA